jgi:hypothetical protein
LAGLLGETGAKIRAMSIPVRAVLLFALSSLPGVIAAAVVYQADQGIIGDITGYLRFKTVVLASVVCTASAVVGLVLSLAWFGTPNGVIGALAGMIIGLGVPLATAVLAQRKEGDLAQAGFYGWVVAFFLIALTIKTILLAPGIDRTGSETPYPPHGPYGSGDDPNSPAKKSGV